MISFTDQQPTECGSANIIDENIINLSNFLKENFTDKQIIPVKIIIQIILQITLELNKKKNQIIKNLKENIVIDFYNPDTQEIKLKLKQHFTDNNIDIHEQIKQIGLLLYELLTRDEENNENLTKEEITQKLQNINFIEKEKIIYLLFELLNLNNTNNITTIKDILHYIYENQIMEKLNENFNEREANKLLDEIYTDIETQQLIKNLTIDKSDVNNQTDNLLNGLMYDENEFNLKPELNEEDKQALEIIKQKFINLSKNTLNNDDLQSQDEYFYRYLFKYYFKTTFFTFHKENRSLNKSLKLPIKLCLTPLPQNNLNFLSKLVFKMLYTTSDNFYGYFHTSLLVGEVKIDWFNSSLCHVTNIIKNPLFTKKTQPTAIIDVTEFTNLEEIEMTIDKIAEICCFYNRNKYYDHSKNCTHFTFIKDILNALNLDINHILYSKPFKYFVKDNFSGLKKFKVINRLQGLIRTVKIENEEFKQFVGKKELIFKTKKELSLFIDFLRSIKYFEMEDGKRDLLLLKSFESAFSAVESREYDNDENVKEEDLITYCNVGNLFYKK
ncbi:hypothetical protein ABK040_003411 [Willaertia magna]